MAGGLGILKVVTLHVVATYKYLGNYISDDLSDDDDFNRQRRTLYVQGNIILRNFSMCSIEVKGQKRLRFRVIHLIEFIQSNNFHIYSIL